MNADFFIDISLLLSILHSNRHEVFYITALDSYKFYVNLLNKNITFAFEKS